MPDLRLYDNISKTNMYTHMYAYIICDIIVFTQIRHNKVLSFQFFRDSKFLCDNLYILQEFTLVLEMLI